MTKTQDNQFDQLLDYLNSQQKSKTKKAPVKVIEEKKTEPVDTKKLLEQSKIHSFIPDDRFADDAKSLGFSTNKFTSMMRSKLIEEYKKLQSYERPYISVTELCDCIRKAYYFRLRYPVNVHKLFQFPYLYLIQKVGIEIHNVIQTVYDFSEVEKTVVSEKFKVKGRVDAIRENFLFDIKSIDVEKFQNKYVNEHYIQANIYAYILNKEYDYKIDTVTIIYVFRNLKRIVPYDIKIHDKSAEAILSRAPVLISCVKNNQVPDPFGSTVESCNYCVFKEQCEKDKPNEIVQPFIKKQITKDKDKVKDSTKQDNGKTAFLL